MAAVLLEGLETIPAGGNFSEAVVQRPTAWEETQNDTLGQVLEAAWSTGAAATKWIEPAETETAMPWGDPRSLANSIQLLASSNSVQRSITSSLQSQMSQVQATATGTITAITATVSGHLTTFTGVPSSSSSPSSAASVSLTANAASATAVA
jgi:hypothetical protein